MVKYEVGTISNFLAKSSGSTEKADPKLAALFGGGDANSTSKVFKTVKVNESQIFKKAPPDPSVTTASKIGKKKNKGKSENIKLTNKDAAGIRVDVKLKAKADKKIKEDSGSPTTELTKKKKKDKKKKKIQQKQSSVQDETISSTTIKSPEKLEKKIKKKKNKRKPEGAEDPLEEGDNVKKNDGKIKQKSKKLKKKPGKIVKQEVKDDQNEDIKSADSENEDGDVEEEETAAESTKEKGSTSVFKTLAERNAPKAKDPEMEARTLFVGNIPGDTDKKKLMKLFKKFGKIETVRLRCGAPSKPTQLKKVAINKKELHSDKSTIAGYIRFQTKEEAEKAASEARGLMINENHLVIDLADQAGKKKDNKKAIFVGNLSLKLSDEELWRFFEDCGQILSVRIIRDNLTGLGKGFGYVNFEERGAIDLAMKKNQQELKNRQVRISKCVKKLKVKKVKDVTHPKGKKEDKNMRKPHEKNRKFPKERRNKTTRNGEIKEYSGDRLAEIGKLKRKSNKPNKGEMRKAKIAKLLTGKNPPILVASSQAPNNRQATFNPHAKNKIKRYFN